MPNIAGFGGLDPLMGSIINDTPKGTSFQGNMSYDIQIVKIGPLIFTQLILLHNPQNSTLYNAFQLARHFKKAPSCRGIYIPI